MTRDGTVTRGRTVTGRSATAALLLAVALTAPRPAAALTSPQAAAVSPSRPAGGSAGGPDTLTLEGAVRTALGEAPVLRSRRAELRAARAGRWSDWGAFLPTADARAGFIRSEFTNVTFQEPEGSSRRLDEPLSGERKSSSLNLVFRWNLLEGGRRLALLEQGAERRRAASHRLSLAERTKVAEVRRRYFEARERKRLVEVAGEQLRARRRDLELTRRRYEIAAARRTELLGARSQLLDARLAAADAREAARRAMRDLRVAMGVEEGALPPATPLASVRPLPSAAELDVQRLVERALRGHPELAALEAEAEAASAGKWVARSRYLPTVALGYSLGRSETLGPEGDFFVLDPSNESRNLSLSLSWTLFDGFDRRAEASAAGTEEQATRARRRMRRLEIEKAVRDAVGEIDRRERRLGLLRRKLQLARERLDLARERYRLGDVRYLELQAAIDGATGAERDVTLERFEYLRAWADLHERVGELGGRGLGGASGPPGGGSLTDGRDG